MDLTDPHVIPRIIEDHIVGIAWFVGYVLFKLVVRYGFGRADMTVSQMAYLVWDPACLVHNIVSVISAIYAIVELSGEGVVGADSRHNSWDPSAACSSVTDPRALILLLQVCHCATDFLVFMPQMLDEPVLLTHHFILLVVSLILPNCNGCYWMVIAYALAEIGSASLTMDAEYRKLGYTSTGLARVVVFGGSRVINLAVLYKIWQVTPTKQLWTLSTIPDLNSPVEVLRFNFPLCMVTALGGSFFMLCVNGVTWYRMWRVYLQRRKKLNCTDGAALNEKKDS